MGLAFEETSVVVDLLRDDIRAISDRAFALRLAAAENDRDCPPEVLEALYQMCTLDIEHSRPTPMYDVKLKVLAHPNCSPDILEDACREPLKVPDDTGSEYAMQAMRVWDLCFRHRNMHPAAYEAALLESDTYGDAVYDWVYDRVPETTMTMIVLANGAFSV